LSRSKINFFIACTAITLSTFVASCTKDDPTAPLPLPPPPSAGGSWSGTLTVGNQVGPFSLNLVQDVFTFSGSGTLGILTVAINGENHYPNINFVCSPSGYQPFTFVGTFTSPTGLSGLINGSGFSDAPAVFTKN